jgi:hypothetical protein
MATIYMPLLNEGVNVWRPVEATPMSEDTYQVMGEMPDIEEWAFAPGTVVRCELKTFDDGEERMTAVEAKLNLFVVEARGQEKRVSTFFVPAYSRDGAIEEAKTSARNAREQEPEATDPFQEACLEVRVGNFHAPGSDTIIFGDWSPLT